MSESDAQKVVIGAVVVSGAVIAWHGIKSTGKATPNLKTFTALFVLAAVLLLASSVVPSLAAGFAVLIGLAVVTSRIG